MGNNNQNNNNIRRYQKTGNVILVTTKSGFVLLSLNDGMNLVVQPDSYKYDNTNNNPTVVSNRLSTTAATTTLPQPLVPNEVPIVMEIPSRKETQNDNLGSAVVDGNNNGDGLNVIFRTMDGIWGYQFKIVAVEGDGNTNNNGRGEWWMIFFRKVFTVIVIVWAILVGLYHRFFSDLDLLYDDYDGYDAVRQTQRCNDDDDDYYDNYNNDGSKYLYVRRYKKRNMD